MKRSIVLALAATTLLPAAAALAQFAPDGTRVGYSSKADMFVWPYVRITWDAATPTVATQDTFLSVTNDDTVDHWMHLEFVDGRSWRHTNRTIKLTGNQSRYWSAFSGQGGSTSGLAFRDLFPSGYVVDANPCDATPGAGRIVEGFIIGWTTDSNDQPVCTNQIAASATNIHYTDENAWEYKPWGFRCGTQDGNYGCNSTNGSEYQRLPSALLVDFWATPGNGAFGPGTSSDFELTLLALPVDLRALPDNNLNGTPGEQPNPSYINDAKDSEPPTTAVQVTTWNEAESEVSNTVRCLTCWDTELASNYGNIISPASCNGSTFVPAVRAASPFASSTLQTLKGKGRLNGSQNQSCNRVGNPNASPLLYGKQSLNLPILGVAHKLITFSAGGTPLHVARAESALTALGERTDTYSYIGVKFDAGNQGPPPTLVAPGSGSIEDMPAPTRTRR